MPRLLLLLLPPRRLIAASCLALFALHSLLVDRPSTASLHPPQNDTNRCVGDAPESDVATKPAGAPRPPRATAASEGRAAREWKSIAFRTRFWGGRVWDKIFRRQILGECEEPRCHVAVDDSSSGGSADAIVFHANDLVDLRYGALPRQESPNQVFVFFSMEPPPLIKGIRWKYFKNFFNWTMTYRRDSDIVVPYGKVMKKLRRETRPNGNYVTQRELDSKTKKNKRAVWMVSHCITTAKREYFVKKLKRYFPVDIYGDCGSKKCGQKTTVPLVNDLGLDPCEALMKNYTFYLALENSLCEEYVTEKLYRTLKLGIIPIVLGGVNYTEFAPPNSYIDYQDFNSVGEMALHMRKVSSDAKLYNGYFKWQEDYRVEVGSPYKPFICDLCKKLHAQTPESPAKTYSHVQDWYINNVTCYSFKARM